MDAHRKPSSPAPADRSHVAPGATTSGSNTDVLLTHDVLRAGGPSACSTASFGRDAKVWGPHQDRHHPRSLHLHGGLSLEPQTSISCASFVRETGPALFLRRDRRPPTANGNSTPTEGSSSASTRAVFAGVCHTALPEERDTSGPARCCFGTDSHTCIGGRVRRVRHGHRQHRCGFYPRHGQAAHQGARDDALLFGWEPCRRV